MNNPSTNRRLLPLRFSVLNILLVMTLVASGITIWRLWREVVPLRSDIRSLRSQLGVLTIDDPQKVHIVQVPSPGFLWNWRVYLPAGHDYWLSASRRSNSETGPEMVHASVFLGKGGREINVRIGIDTKNKYVYSLTGEQNAPLLETDGSKTLSGTVMVEEEIAGHKDQLSATLNGPIMLLRYLEAGSTANPRDGMIISITDKRP